MGSGMSSANAPDETEDACVCMPHAELMMRMSTVPHVVPGSVRLDVVDDARRTARLAFKVNAPVPCRVNTFTLASEDTATGAIDAAPTTSVLCGPGYELPLPRDGTSVVHAISVPNLTTEYLGCQGGKYPFVIRVESFTASHATYMPAALPEAGAALEHHTNAHTVLGCLRFQPDGSWAILVLKERLWLAGTPCSLPDGLPALPNPSGPPRPSANPRLAAPLAQFAPAISPPAWPPLPLAQPPPAGRPYYLAPSMSDTYTPRQLWRWQPVQQQLWQAPLYPAPLLLGRCQLCRRRPAAVLNSHCQHACMCAPCGAAQAESWDPCCPECGEAPDILVPISAPVA